jgi:hypothetical protein
LRNRAIHPKLRAFHRFVASTPPFGACHRRKQDAFTAVGL